MNHLAKFFRVSGGIFLLAGLAAFFLPVLVINQENYPVIKFSGFDFVKTLFAHVLRTEQIVFIVFLIILPFVLSLITGIIGILGSVRQIVSCIGSLIIACLEVAFFFNLNIIEPERLNDAQIYEKGTGIWILVIFSVVAAALGIAGFITTPRIKKDVKVQEEKDEIIKKVQNNAEGVAEQKAATKTAKETAIATGNSSGIHENKTGNVPKGILTGLSGEYKDAQIPFQPGEALKFGRNVSNDIVFTGTSRVSRFHCTITWYPDKNKYQIVDKSANGSFIEGREECLPQNIAVYLEPGTVLYIGSKENSFRLD